MSDQRPTLPRVSRDVRVTGTPAGPTGAWTGIGRPFGGVLDPGVPVGEWPPVGLSHLALGGLLADALLPAPRSESRDRSDSSEETTSSAQSETSEDRTEPVVREVIREEGSTTATRLSSDTPAHAEQADGVTPSTREPPTGSPQDGIDGTDGADGEHPSGATARTSADRQQPLGRIPSEVTAPRTVLRQATRGPAAPRTVSERAITQLVEGSARSPSPEDSAEAGGSGSEAADESTALASQPADTATHAWQEAPVERTMPTVPPDRSGPAATAADSSGPPTPDVVREGTAVSKSTLPEAAGSNRTTPGAYSNRSSASPELGGRSSVAGTGVTFDGPSMTVLQDDPATSDVSDTGPESPESGQTQRNDVTNPAGDGERAVGSTTVPGDASGQPSPQTRAAGLAPSGEEAVSSLIEGMDPGSEQVVQRTIENVVRQPRVIDELYHEIERRRRIERERGGDL